MTVVETRIAVGVDGTASNTEAVLWAIDRARRTGSELELVHALNAPPLGEHGPDDRAAAGSALVEGVAEHARTLGVPVRCTVVDRPAGPVLVEASQRAGLLVVGRRSVGAGHRGADSGSVGRHVGRYAACPVVVVPQRSAPATGRVVVHLTGDPADRPALDFAFDHAAATGSEIEAVHAVAAPSPDGACSPLADERTERRHLAAQIMLAEELAGYATTYPDVKVVRHSVPADPSDALLWASAHADLMVLSAPRPYDAMVDRPTHEMNALRHAHCPVVFAR